MDTGSKRSSGLDFADRAAASDDTGPAHLLRNVTERRRLQGLMRSNSTHSNVVSIPEQNKTLSLKQRYDVWMVNEGGRRLFFFVWIFLHALVFALGFIHYQLKDNLTGARATFGITFGSFPPTLSATWN